MKSIFSLLLFFNVILLFSQTEVDQVSTEKKVDPIGIGNEHPQFSWKLTSSLKNVQQQAYEVQIATSQEDLQAQKNLMWNTGKVPDDRSTDLKYEGTPLESDTKYFWRVRVWDNYENQSKWSSTATFHTGFYNPKNQFLAEWIGPGYKEDSLTRPSPLFRKNFKIKNKNFTKATVYITAHGMYEAKINGQRVGKDYFTPGWTSYDERLQYQVYDVTELLLNEENTIGVILGNGWYRDYLAWGGLRNHYGEDIALLLQLNITYEDGSTESIKSDSSWKSTIGPILNSEIYDGELFDANREKNGWSTNNFTDSEWSDVKVYEFEKENLIATENTPIRKQEKFAVKSISKSPEGDIIADFGQNLVGFVEVRLKGEKGDTLKIYHTEVLDKDGNFYDENLRGADQTVTYILDGNEKLYEPHFTFQGFRYIKIEGDESLMDPENFTAVALYSDMEQTGEFSTSNPLINQLQQNILWGQKGNFLDVPTDCPQRDERLGWTGDAQAFFRTAAYNMDVENFFSKWLKDLAVDQLENGAVPYVIPNVLGPSSAGSAGWGDVATIIPWEMYLLYGNEKVLEQQYSSMKAWVEFIRSKSEDNLWNSGFHFGDWLFYTPEDDRDGKAAITDKFLIAQCFYAHSTQLLINAAEVLEKQEDVDEYSTLLKNIKDSFQKEYMTSTGRLVSGTQTAYVLALHFDMLPEELREKAAESLVENIRNYGYHLTTGFLGTPYINHVLSRFGYSDIAYRLLLQDTYPSWLYPVTMGATTVWERWDGIKPDGTFQTPNMNSFNHYAYGAIGDWMYQNVAGIRPDDLGPGYKQIILKPVPGGGLSHASGSLETTYGSIVSKWEFNQDDLIYEVEIPVNSLASVYIPAKNVNNVLLNNSPVQKSKDVEVGNLIDNYLKVNLGSGNYKFRSKDVKSLYFKDVDTYAGTYLITEGFFDKIEIKEKDDNLFLIVDGKEHPLQNSEKKDIYITTNNKDNQLQFQTNRSGIVNSLILNFNGMKMQGIKR